MEQETVVAIAGADLWRDAGRRGRADRRARSLSELAASCDLAIADRGRAPTWRLTGASTWPPVLGSRATHVMSRMGGLQGRALRAGDRVALGPSHGAREDEAVRCAAFEGRRATTRPPRPASRLLRREPRSMRSSARASRSPPQSDRMGYRLLEAAIAGRRPRRHDLRRRRSWGACRFRRRESRSC